VRAFEGAFLCVRQKCRCSVRPSVPICELYFQMVFQKIEILLASLVSLFVAFQNMFDLISMFRRRSSIYMTDLN